MPERIAKKDHSKSIKQALLMQEQRQEELPFGVTRRLPFDVAATFHANDLREGYFFDSAGSPKEKQER